MAREIDEAWIDEAIEQHRRIGELRAEFDRAVAAHTVTVHSPDDAVEVRVTAAGDIADVRIRGDLTGHTPDGLAREIQAVVVTAAEAARWARAKLHDEMFSAFQELREE